MNCNNRGVASWWKASIIANSYSALIFRCLQLLLVFRLLQNSILTGSSQAMNSCVGHRRKHEIWVEKEKNVGDKINVMIIKGFYQTHESKWEEWPAWHFVFKFREGVSHPCLSRLREFCRHSSLLFQAHVIPSLSSLQSCHAIIRSPTATEMKDLPRSHPFESLSNLFSSTGSE